LTKCELYCKIKKVSNEEGDNIILLTDKAAEALWNKTEPKMKKIAYIKMQGCPDEADDVISETYLAFCEHIEKKGMPEKPEAWLYSVLNKRIQNKFRELYKISRREILFEETEALPYEVDFDEELLKSLPIDKLKKKLLSELTEDELTLYEYIYIKKYKYKKIAKKLHATNAAVKQRHYRLCNKIKKLAKKLCYETEL